MDKHIIRLNAKGDGNDVMQTIGYSFPDAIESGDPVETAHVFYDQALKQTTIGIWESQAGTIRFEEYPFDELCIIVDGELQLEEEGQEREVFRAGDVFIIRKGFRGLWIMPSALKKFYAELLA